MKKLYFENAATVINNIRTRSDITGNKLKLQYVDEQLEFPTFCLKAIRPNVRNFSSQHIAALLPITTCCTRLARSCCTIQHITTEWPNVKPRSVQQCFSMLC